MNIQTLTNLSIIVNLLSSLFNVLAYGFGYLRVSRAKVDGKYKTTKRVLLFEFITIAISTLLFAIVFFIAIFDKSHLSVALYILNFALLVMNLGFNINVALLIHIVDFEK